MLVNTKSKIPPHIALGLLVPILGGIVARRIKAISQVEMHGYMLFTAALILGWIQALTKSGYMFGLHVLMFGYLMMACSVIYQQPNKNMTSSMLFVAATICVGILAMGTGAFIERGMKTLLLYVPLTIGAAILLLGRVQQTIKDRRSAAPPTE